MPIPGGLIRTRRCHLPLKCPMRDSLDQSWMPPVSIGSGPGSICAAAAGLRRSLRACPRCDGTPASSSPSGWSRPSRTRTPSSPAPGPSGVRRPARDRHLLPDLPATVASDPQGPGLEPRGAWLSGGRDLPLDRARGDRPAGRWLDPAGWPGYLSWGECASEAISCAGHPMMRRGAGNWRISLR